MKSSILLSRSMVTMACTAAVALAYGATIRPTANLHAEPGVDPASAIGSGLAATCSPGCHSPSSATTASSTPGPVRSPRRRL